MLLLGFDIVCAYIQDLVKLSHYEKTSINKDLCVQTSVLEQIHGLYTDFRLSGLYQHLLNGLQ